MLLTAVPFLRRTTWRLPDTYHLAGHGRGTATLKFYEGRDILPITADQASAGPATAARAPIPPPGTEPHTGSLPDAGALLDEAFGNKTS